MALRVQLALLGLLLTLVGELYAYTPKEGNVNLIVGPFYSRTNIQESGAKFNKYQAGFGVLAVGDISSKGSLEVGIFSMHKSYFVEQYSYLDVEKTELVHITMGYRFWLTRILSASVTFFSAYSIGKPKVLYNDFPVTEDVKSSAEDLTEYGFDFALQFEIFSIDRFAVVVDTRYSASLTSKDHESSDHYGALVGARYTWQDASSGTALTPKKPQSQQKRAKTKSN